MSTAVVEIKNDIAYSFLQNLEQLHLIRIIKHEVLNKSLKQKPSERFAGCLSNNRAEELQQELVQMRDEWNRAIY